MSAANSTDVAFAGLAEQARLVRDGELTSVELTAALLERIERIDSHLNAFQTVLDEQALAEAARRDEQRADGERLSLLGVPIAIKDDTDVEGVVTTHGTAAFVTPAKSDAEVVRRLRTAGAVIIGKTTLPEFGQWPFTESTAHGYTRNPWNTDRTTCGSSGGSGAAVAAGLVAAALGTDGGGSIRMPAAACGIFGLKPQRGRVSTAPLPDSWRSLGTTGALTRTVLDTAIFYDAVRGNVASDTYRADEPRMSFVEAATTTPPKLRIAVSAKAALPGFKIDREQREALLSTAEALRMLGHDVIEHDIKYPYPVFAFVPQEAAGLNDEIAMADEPKRVERLTKQNALTGRLFPVSAAGAIRRGAEIAAKVNAIFDEFDLVLTPTIAPQPRKVGALKRAPGLLATVRAMRYVAYTVIWNVTGNPAASVPAGFSTDGMPLAVQLIAAPNDEPTILQVAAQLEEAQPWIDQRPPAS